MTKTNLQKMRACFARFNDLNPELAHEEEKEFYAIADAAPADCFPEFSQEAERLIAIYLDSSPKRVSRVIFGEYFEYLNRSARLLKEAEEIPEIKEEPEAKPQSIALVPTDAYDSLAWCKILNRAKIPQDLVKAAEACRRRNEIVNTVLEYIFEMLHRIDSTSAFAWEMTFLENHRGTLDADLLRDLLRVWLRQPQVPRCALVWAEEWSGDDNLAEQWPMVVRLADRLLCRHALLAWSKDNRPRHSRVAQLQILIRRATKDQGDLTQWLDNALAEMGECVAKVYALNREKKTSSRSPEEHAMLLLREIRRLEALFPPVLICSNYLLELPEAAPKFAFAVFGLLGLGREIWEERLLELSTQAVRRMFLNIMRDGGKPTELIHKLTFGDRTAFLKLYAELDLATANFDSIKQREKITAYLAAFYAGYRESELLTTETGRRYRNLMRLLHEDHLGQFFDREKIAQIVSSPAIAELVAIAAESRRYLSRRRDLEDSLEEMSAVELNYTRALRHRRLKLIHSLL